LHGDKRRHEETTALTDDGEGIELATHEGMMVASRQRRCAMDWNIADETPRSELEITPAETVAGGGQPIAGSARKSYQTPRLTEHGRLPALTRDQTDFSGPLPSDRNAKHDFVPVDPRAILARVVELPIERWSYKGETVRHLGPMAQDFAAAFGVGADDRHIFPLDASGVALAAIQGLHGLVRDQAARLEALDRELTALRQEAAALRAELAVHEGAPVV
jgi:hypothetical protein